jgi:hypothetical protein
LLEQPEAFLLEQQLEAALVPSTALRAGLSLSAVALAQPAALALLAQQPEAALVPATALSAGLAAAAFALQHAEVAPQALAALQAAFCSAVQLVEQPLTALTAPNEA